MKFPAKLQLLQGITLILVTPFAISGNAFTQPSPANQPPSPTVNPAPQSRVAPLPPAPHTRSAHDRERAWRDILRAEAEAYRVTDLAAQASSTAASNLVGLADRLLSEAQSSYEAGNYFQSAETALAAKDTYEAAETLYEGQLGYVTGRHSPENPSRSYYNAPYQVSEELAKAEAEAAYYQSEEGTATDLLRQARELANPAGQLASVSHSVNPASFADLTNNRAAIHLAKAATHLMRAERGF